MKPSTPTPVYRALASSISAAQSCEKTGKAEWRRIHEMRANEIVKQCLPSGSGFDDGTRINWERSDADRLVFDVGFHHMSEHGYYVGWTEHQVIVSPSLLFEIDIRVTGRDRNEIKNYIGECFYHALRENVSEHVEEAIRRIVCCD